MTAQITGHILLVDDEATALKALRRILEKQGHRVHTCQNPARALEALAELPIDVLVSDLKMPLMDGMELLDRAKGLAPQVEVIIVSGFASLDGAVEAAQKGACHFLAKPVTPQQMRDKVQEALGRKRLRDQALAREAAAGPAIVGQSPPMRRLAELIAQIAPTDCTVLIQGQSGTGKELAAKAIHAQSRRAKGPLVAVNCAAISPSLLESELFGHEKGAFTGAEQTKIGLLEAAHGGTIFFDEIGETPPAMQVKLLRALQERQFMRVGGRAPLSVDLRVLAATARDLALEARLGAFRQDLFYRLSVVELTMPPLAQRRSDIPLLAQHFLEEFGRRMEKSVDGFDPAALELLRAYAFPGNVRELRNIVERAMALCQGRLILPRDLPPDLAAVRLSSLQRQGGPVATLEEQERAHIEQALRQTGGMRAKAAALLGIDRVSLWRKMKKHGLA
ncbi:two component, sigma54 specific, transcriptional regulator, Fis family [Desulfarculus baarsii DSM 2075]|uniref:Two component, sigma54 specific, transcriptional regulator, Fis family n=1 Tax=Desulfarculus baarsii (strain ATCC 33931 / DSM 2075 / LMG 7858 / VKM B-1802 / 2st14) TaxID=644282 RepID=E1QDR0_DESB2|nr:sigma-54 dependent transcriptional regulator [Desulfarculus baarsii]ADK83696.1 two component, sigma54 specific, transcriptional regulator, Fis family [Desulfarculus baarsii DSM 2075]